MKLALTTVICAMALASIAQSPVKWNFSSKKIAENQYEINFSASVEGPWHIYSQTTPDGGPLATSFSFNKNPLVQLDGKAREAGKIITKYEDVFGINVIYFDGKASFTQVVKLKTAVKTVISGKIEWMACNEVQCLPPTTTPFSVSIP